MFYWCTLDLRWEEKKKQRDVSNTSPSTCQRWNKWKKSRREKKTKEKENNVVTYRLILVQRKGLRGGKSKCALQKFGIAYLKSLIQAERITRYF